MDKVKRLRRAQWAAFKAGLTAPEREAMIYRPQRPVRATIAPRLRRQYEMVAWWFLEFYADEYQATEEEGDRYWRIHGEIMPVEVMGQFLRWVAVVHPGSVHARPATVTMHSFAERFLLALQWHQVRALDHEMARQVLLWVGLELTDEHYPPLIRRPKRRAREADTTSEEPGAKKARRRLIARASLPLQRSASKPSPAENGSEADVSYDDHEDAVSVASADSQ